MLQVLEKMKALYRKMCTCSKHTRQFSRISATACMRYVLHFLTHLFTLHAPLSTFSLSACIHSMQGPYKRRYYALIDRFNVNIYIFLRSFVLLIQERCKHYHHHLKNLTFKNSVYAYNDPLAVLDAMFSFYCRSSCQEICSITVRAL